jgi:hypothetical protein
MNKSAGKTAQYKQSKPGAAQPPRTAGIENSGESEYLHRPDYSIDRFLVINVRERPTREQVIEAVDEALRTIDIPFFQYTTPGKDRVRKADAPQTDSGTMPPCTALLMLVRQEGY